MTRALDSVTPIDRGFCVKLTEDGRYCIDVMEMMYNWRILLSPRPPLWPEPHVLAERGYFAHGHDSEGRPRNKRTALLAAMAAAQVWTGDGDPPGFDKRAF